MKIKRFLFKCTYAEKNCPYLSLGQGVASKLCTLQTSSPLSGYDK